MQKHIVVIGGGITGLAAAYEAVFGTGASPFEPKVTILEQSQKFGGKIKTHQTEDFIIESGPDSIYTLKPGGMQLIRELGLEPELVYSPRNLKTGILRHGKLYPIPPGMSFGLPTKITPFIFNALIPFGGKLRGLADFFLPASDSKEDKSIGDLLRRRIGNDLVDILAEPMLAGIHAGDIDKLSLEAVAPYLQKMEKDNRSLILAMLKQGKAADAAAKRRKAEEGGKGPVKGVFVTLSNGLEQLVEILVSRLEPQVNLRNNSAVIQINQQAGGGFELTVRSADGQTEQISADAVILSIPTFAAKRLIPAKSKVYNQLLDIPYVSTGTVSLVYPSRKNEIQLPYTGFLIPRGEDEMLTACTVVSSKWPNSSKSGNVIVRGYIGRDGEETSLGKSDDIIALHMRKQMEKYLGLAGEPIWQTVDRWPQAMPQYWVGHNRRIHEIQKQLAQDVPHLYLTGSGYKGMGIADCITQGRNSMKTCLEELQFRQDSIQSAGANPVTNATVE